MYDTRVTSASLRMDTVTALTVREGRRMAISPEKRLSAPTMLGVPIGVDII